MIITFKAKAKERQIVAPELGPQHVRGPLAFNKLQFAMALRRIYRANPVARIPKHLNLDNLPSHVTVDETGFLAHVTVDFDRA